jgi:hypothetical protein
MTLMGKDNPEYICEHLKEVIEKMIDNEIEMSHDYEGSFLHCHKCDCCIALEAYGEKFEEEDIME